MEKLTVKPKLLSQLIQATAELGQPLFIWGPPGCGKSAIARQAAESRNIPYYDIRATLLDPVDLRGVPNVIDVTITRNGKTETRRVTEWCPPDFLPREEHALVNFDELNSAPPQVQAAFYQIILDRQTGSWKAADGIIFIACGNREGDRGVVNRMPSPLANRFVHVELEPDIEEWREWVYVKYGGGKCGESSTEIATFMRYRPELLFNFEANTVLRAFPTPRAWEKVIQQLGAWREGKISAQIFQSLSAGTVGPGACVELNAFLKVKERLPDVDALLQGQRWTVPSEPDVLHTLCGALGWRCNAETRDAVWKVLWQLPGEYQIALLREASLRDPDFTLAEDWERFCEKHSYLKS